MVRSTHSLGEANFHLQFTSKYRRDVFRDGEVKKVCESYPLAIRYYLEHSQSKHWKAVDHGLYLQSKQRSLSEYTA